MFYIKKIELKTGVGTISTLELKSGLNIIYGQSNTGKSLVLDCIDYLFGAKEYRFDTKLEVKNVKLILDVDGKPLTMSRDIDSNDIDITSSVDYISNGTYKITKAKKNINSVWLRLIGIDEDVKILKTLGGESQRLTLRTFYHLLLLNEDKLPGSNTILVQGNGPNKKVETPVLTSLLYLATNNSYLPNDAIVDPKIKKAKKDAVKTFVDRSMLALETRTASELENFSKITPTELRTKINQTLNEIDEIEERMEQASNQCREITDTILKFDKQIAESRLLLNRNDSLFTQYESDIKRLTFIVDGDIQHESAPVLNTCPFCNGQLEKETEKSCIDAAVAEVEKINIQIKDLCSVQANIKAEIESLKTNY